MLRIQDDSKSKQGLAEIYEVCISSIFSAAFEIYEVCTFHPFLWYTLNVFFFNCWQQEYVQKTDPTSAPLSFKDEQKNEVQILTVLLCFCLLCYLISFSIIICFIFSCIIQSWLIVPGCVTPLYIFHYYALIFHLVLVIRLPCCSRDSVWSWMPYLILTLPQNLYDTNVLIISW